MTVMWEQPLSHNALEWGCSSIPSSLHPPLNPGHPPSMALPGIPGLFPSSHLSLGSLCPLSCPGCWGWKGHWCQLGLEGVMGLNCCHWRWQQMLSGGGCAAKSGALWFETESKSFPIRRLHGSCSEQSFLSQLRTCSTSSWGGIPVLPAWRAQPGLD